MPRTPGSSGRAGLSRDAVLATAAELADEHGIDSVTLARLADALGIRTPSLYNHISGLDDLRRGLALVALRDLAARVSDATADSTGRHRLIALALAYRAYAQEHPGLYAAIARGAGPADDAALASASRALVDLALQALPDGCEEESLAIHAVRTLRSLLHGFISLDAIGGFGLPVAVDESFAFAIHTFADGLQARIESNIGHAG